MGKQKRSCFVLISMKRKLDIDSMSSASRNSARLLGLALVMLTLLVLPGTRAVASAPGNNPSSVGAIDDLRRPLPRPEFRHLSWQKQVSGVYNYHSPSNPSSVNRALIALWALQQSQQHH